MKYYLNFVFKIKREHDLVVYDDNQFDEQPVPISAQQICEILEDFLQGFEEVALVLPKDLEMNSEEYHSLAGIDGKAWICQTKDVNPDVLAQLSSSLVNLLQKIAAETTEVSFMKDRSSENFRTLRELTEFRNYLRRYLEDPAKPYQKGFLFIMS